MRTKNRLKPLKKDPLIIRREKKKLKKKNSMLERKKKNLNGYPDMMVMELDPDIVLEIFSLLPFKKAVQCRWVCKSWRTLLDDDFLINIHAKTQLKLHGYDHHHVQRSSSSTIVSFTSISLLLKKKKSFFSQEKTSLFGFYDDNLSSYKESSFNVSSSSKLLKHTTMINSCNGLICLKKDYVYPKSNVIYNPVTTEILRVPWGTTGKYRIGGFGYHPSTKEYKILRTIDDDHHQIYTLGTTGIWKDIEGSTSAGRSNFKYDVPGVHVNGALYWITENDDDKHGDNKEKKREMMMMIISFDLADEEFRALSMLPPPLLNNMKPKPHYKLVESQGCLFLFVDQYSRLADYPHIELWVMKEKDADIDHDNNNGNGFPYYWSNLMEISTVGHHNKGDYEFLALTLSGKVLFWHNNSVLTCFDPKEERFVSISDVPAASSHRYRSGSAAIVPHTNSLVSLIALGASPKN